MRILVTIPHFYRASPAPRYGSEIATAAPFRARLLTDCLRALHAHCGERQSITSRDGEIRSVIPANAALGAELDIVICTTGADHLVDKIAGAAFRQHATEAEPRLLGYECHQVLADNLGRYDYYGYLEDDLTILDPLFFHKLAWFAATFGEQRLLQPNRFIMNRDLKHYFETITVSQYHDEPPISARLMGIDLAFRRPRHGHSGCFFLTEAQMRRWTAQSYFMDRSSAFIGPLESAATLGITRTFTLYKPDEPNAAFLELRDQGRPSKAQLLLHSN